MSNERCQCLWWVCCRGEKPGVCVVRGCCMKLSGGGCGMVGSCGMIDGCEMVGSCGMIDGCGMVGGCEVVDGCEMVDG